MTTETDPKGRILKTAVDLFSKYGFRSISMDDIAHHLGMSKKTLYQYFSDKDEIVTLAIQNHLAYEREILQQIKTEAKDAVDFIIRVNNYLVRNIRETRSAAIHDLKKYHIRAWEYVEKFKSDFLLKAVAENLRTGVSEGNFRKGIHVDVIARLRLEEVSMLLNQDSFPKTHFNVAEASAIVLDHFIAGIATEKGLKLYTKYRGQESPATTIL
jgi:AcrR family transcriptional regulator